MYDETIQRIVFKYCLMILMYKIIEINYF